MRVLITGGAGFIGSHTAKLFRDMGHEVKVLDVSDNDSAIYCDVRSIGAFDILATCIHDADAVVHLAACLSSADIHGCSSTNIYGTSQIAKYCALYGKRMVYASSAGVYGNATEGCIREGLSPAPIDMYALTKYGGELAVESLRNDYVILRFFNVYGENQKMPAVVPSFVHAVESKTLPSITGDGKQVRDFVHVSDVARAILFACETKQNNTIYNVGTGVGTSMLELWEMVSKTYTGKCPWPSWDKSHAPGIAHSVASTTKAAHYLGFKAKVTLEEGISRLKKLQSI